MKCFNHTPVLTNIFFAIIMAALSAGCGQELYQQPHHSDTNPFQDSNPSAPNRPDESSDDIAQDLERIPQKSAFERIQTLVIDRLDKRNFAKGVWNSCISDLERKKIIRINKQGRIIVRSHVFGTHKRDFKRSCALNDFIQLRNLSRQYLEFVRVAHNNAIQIEELSEDELIQIEDLLEEARLFNDFVEIINSDWKSYLEKFEN